MLSERQPSVVFGPNDEALLVLLEMCEQLELIAFAIHDMDHLTVTKMLLARLDTACPTSGFAIVPFLDLVATEVLLAATAPRSLFAPEGLNMYDSQRAALAPCVHNQSDVRKESSLAGR